MITVIKGTFPCPWCDKAVALLESRGLEHRVREFSRYELIQLADKAGWTTVPMVFNGDKLIGGFSELEKWLDINAG